MLDASNEGITLCKVQEIEKVLASEDIVIFEEQDDVIALEQNFKNNYESGKIKPFIRRFVIKLTIKGKDAYLFVHSLNKDNEYFAVDYYEKRKFICTITFKNDELINNQITIQRMTVNTTEDAVNAVGKSLFLIAISVLFFMEKYANNVQYISKKKNSKKLKKNGKSRTTYEYSISLGDLKETLINAKKLRQLHNVKFIPKVSDIENGIISNWNLDVVRCDIKLKQNLIDYYETAKHDNSEHIPEKLLMTVVDGKQICFYCYIRRVQETDVVQIDFISKEKEYIESILLINITNVRRFENVLVQFEQSFQEKKFTEKEIQDKAMFVLSCLTFYVDNKNKCYITSEINTSMGKKNNSREYQGENDINVKSRKVIYLPHTIGYRKKANEAEKDENSRHRICNYTTEEWNVRPYKQVRRHKDGTTYVLDITPKPRKRKKELLEESKKNFPSGKEYRITIK